MSRFFRVILLVALGATLVSCSKFRTYSGPEITRVVVLKGVRQMHLFHNETVIVSYPIELGFTPIGAKQEEGDGRTPEGRYYVDRKNPDSEYHLSVGINYPDEADIARAEEAGIDPGRDIFIHGGPVKAKDRGRPDWTAGCIAVTNREIEDIYAMLQIGTPVDIYP